jgi:hypothetical protein
MTLDYWNYKVENVIGIVHRSRRSTTASLRRELRSDLPRSEREPLASEQRVRAGHQHEPGQLPDRRHRHHGNYTQPIDKWGSPAFTLLGTYVNQFVIEPIPGLGTYDCVGLYGPNCGFLIRVEVRS